MAIKGVIGEEDARTRIAELKAQVVQAEVELASLDEATPPISTVFAAIADQLKIGVPIEDTLDESSAKIGLPDFRFFTVAVGLQYATGGNLTSRRHLKFFPISYESGARHVSRPRLPPARFALQPIRSAGYQFLLLGRCLSFNRAILSLYGRIHAAILSSRWPALASC
jgi:hypothetical protein